VVAVGGDLTPLLGEQAQLTITFDNVPDGSPGGDVGYSPYVDLVLPLNGADGSGPGSLPPFENDGVGFVSASFLGTPLASTVIEFDASGQATHPFARDATGNLRVVSAADYGAQPGDQLVVLRLPFGSFVPSQPAAEILVTVQVSPLADLNAPLPVTAVGGFAFGRDSLDNPIADAPVLGAPATAQITPTLLTVAKSFNGDELETATGPSFPNSYTITLDLAPGQTISNASILDALPNGIVLIGAPILSGAPGTAVYDPLAHTVLVTLDGDVTGGAGPEATVTVNFYVAETLTPGEPATPVLDSVSGAPRTIENDVSAEATWTPLDPRDPTITVVVDPPGPEAVFTARSIATQKTQAIISDLNAPGLGPGDTLEYAIDIQVSDYFQFRNLVLDDLLSDGQAYVAGSARIEVVEAGQSAGSGGFDAQNISVVRDPTTGRTGFRFAISDQLVANGAPDGVLTGGDGGLGPTTLRIVYQAVVERFFLRDGEAVGQGDTLSNTATISAEVVDANGVPTGGTPGDGTASSGTIATGGVTKTVYALNGVAPAPGPLQIAAGDLITFRLTYEMPQTLTNELRLTDFLPLPVFDVDTFTLTLDNTVSGVAPPENVAKWGPLAGGFSALVTNPSQVELLKDSVANSLTFVFRDLSPAVPVATTADILFTVKVVDRPFGDGLLLTNQVAATEISTTGTTTSSQAITQVTLTEPVLQLTKGIVATDSPQGDFTPGAVGPVGVTPPGSAGFRFTGPINSANLALAPVDSDLSDVDSGDRVTFAIVIENIGRGRNGAFDIFVRDTLPQGYRIPATGENLQITDGAGNPITGATAGGLFSGGILITDPPGAGQGALAPFSPDSGANILVITYDLEITETPQPRSQITNVATIANYSAIEGGINRVPSTSVPTQDIATTLIGEPTFEKSVVSTSVSQTGSSAGDPALPDLTIGESITFELVTTLREGRIRGFQIDDLLPDNPGQLAFVSAEVVSIGGNLFVRDDTQPGTIGAPLGAPTIITAGRLTSFVFADDIVNRPDNMVNDDDRIVVRVTAVLTDVPGNAPGTEIENVGAAVFIAAGQIVAIEDSAAAEVVGPAFTVVKNADREIVQGGDVVTYTVEFSPLADPFAGPLFDLNVTDTLDNELGPGTGKLILVRNSLTLLEGPTGTVLFDFDFGGTFFPAAQVPVLLPGEFLRFTYQAQVAPSVVAGTTLPNLVGGQGDSYPGTPPPVGDPPLDLERTFLQTASDSVRVPGPGIVKTVAEVDTSLPETGSNRFDGGRPDLAIGEIVTYRITVAFPEAVSTDVFVADYLPGALAAVRPIDDGLFLYLDAEVVRVGGSLSLAGPITRTPDDFNGDGITDSVVFSLGTVTNTPDGVFNAGDEIEFTVTARVLDAPVNRAGQAPVNLAGVVFGAGLAAVTDTAVVDIVEPVVGVIKSSSASSGDAGDRVTYTVTLPTNDAQAAPAFDMVVTDVIPVGFEIDLPTLRFTTAVPQGTTLDYDAPTRTITVTVPVYRFEDPNIRFTYDVIVSNAVRPTEQLINTATLVFDSHPGDPGDAFQRNYGPVRDTETFTIDLPSLSKRVVNTDIPATQFLQLQPQVQDVAIGETVTYLVTLRLPEATTNIVVTDFLPRAPGAPPSAGDMEWISSEIVAIGRNLQFIGPPPPGGVPVVGDEGEVTSRFNDGVLDTVRWNFGLVTNRADNIESEDDLIVFQIVARVPNEPANQPRDVLINLAQTQYSRADGSTGLVIQSEAVEIVGPELNVDKTASITTGDAGDVVTYTVTITHEALSTSSAFALVLADLLEPNLQLVVGSVTTSLAGATVVRGNTAGDTTVEVTLGELLRPSDPLLPAQVLTITYQAELADTVRPGTVIPNTAELDWQSAPSGFPEARPDADSDDAVVAVVLNNTIDKTVVDTSLPETDSGFFDPNLPDLAIGETVTYEIRVRLGEGTGRVLVQDVLPAGMVFVSGSVVSIGANISNTEIGVGAAPVVSGGNITFDFGNDVVDAGDNIETDADVIVMRVTARVLPGVNAGDVLTNNATLTNDVGTISDTAPVEVVEPAVTITKTPSAATGDAGDEITFTVVIAQAAGATAPLYDFSAEDILPAAYALVAGSASATRGTVTENGNTVRVTLAGAALLPTDDATTADDETRIVLSYRARLVDAVQPGQVVTNTAGFDGVSAPGGGPTTETYAGSDDASVTVVMPVLLAKEIVATSLPETGGGQFDPSLVDLAVGESVTYRLTATLSEGTQSLVIEDTLPDGLEFVSASVVAVGAGLAPALLGTAAAVSGQVVRFDFGTVVNAGNNVAGDGTVAVEIVARVRDVAGNVAGTTLTNAGVVSIASPDDPGAPGGTETATADTSAEIVEPSLVIAKVAPAAFLLPGEAVTYTVTLSHAANSTAPAYDIVLADLIADPFLVLVSGTVTTSTGTVALGNGAGDGEVRIEVPVLTLGEVLTVNFTVRVTADAPPATNFTNVATADFDSAPGPGGRPGSVTDGTETPGVPTFAKAIIATSNPDTGSGVFDPANPDLAVGETVTYRLTVTLPRGTTDALVVEDLLPNGLTPIAARTVAIGAGLAAGAPSIGISGQAVTIAFGTVVNGSDPAVDDADRIVIEVDARLDDLPGIIAGAELLNAARTTFSIGGREGTLTDAVAVDVVAPELTIAKVVDLVTGDAGDVFTYTVTVQHAISSTSGAYDLVIEDVLDPLFTPVSVNATSGTAEIVGNTIRLTLPRLMPTDAPVTLTYVVALRDTVEPGQVVGNTAVLSYDSNPGPGGRPGTGSASAENVTAVFALELAKTVVATSLPETGSGAFDPALTDLAIGETVTYRLVATLSEGTQTLLIRDTLPDGLDLVSAAVTVVGAGLSPTLLGVGNTGTGQLVLFDFGTVVNAGNNVEGDGTVTIEVVARTRDAAGNVAGAVLTNAAEAVVTAPTDPQAPGGTLTDAAEISVEIVEPEVIVIKSSTLASGDAGDEGVFTLVIRQTAGATAPLYDLVLTDPIPAGLELVPGSVTTTRGTVVEAGGALRVEAGGAALAPADDPATAEDEAAITITYRVRLTDAVQPGQVVVNTAGFVGLSAPAAVAGGEARPYAGSDDASVTVVMPVLLAKEIVATSLPETGGGQFDPSLVDLAVGESVTYRLTATLSEGTQSLVIEDTLPDGLEFVSASVVAVGAGLAPALLGTAAAVSGQVVRFDFGTVVNAGNNVAGDGTVAVEIVARVRDVAGNVAGTTLTNAGVVSIASPDDPGAPGGTETATADTSAEIVEPSLVIAKVVDLVSGDAGDVFTYTVTVRHAAGSTSAAYDIVITDLLDPRLRPFEVSASVGTAAILGDTVRLDVPLLRLEDAPVTLTYRIRLADTVEPGQVIGNTAVLDYDSSAGPGGRPGSGSASAEEITVVFALNLTKEIVATSLPETGSDRFDPDIPDLAVGETVTYELVATLSEGTQRLVITDMIPDGLLPLEGQAVVASTGPGISAGAGGTLTPTAVISGQRVTFDFGTLVNTGDNTTDDGDRVVVRITARVLDLPINERTPGGE
jgi:large repetitive protein